MKKTLVVILLIVSITLVFTACKDTGNKPNDKVNATATPAATETPVATATPEPTATPVPGPTLKPLSEEEKGKPQKDAEIIAIEDFDDGTIDYDNFQTKSDENIVIKDGEMHIETVWAAIAPLYEDYGIGTKHNQYEWSSDVYITHKMGDAPHVAYWVGARVPKEATADYPGGFWLAFNYSKTVYVYPGGNNFKDQNGNLVESWAAKCFSIKAPEDFTTKHKVTVVDTGDALYYYMNTATEENYLLLKVEFDGADLICYGNDGTQVFAGENVVNEIPAFSIFSHRSKTHTDNVVLKGY